MKLIVQTKEDLQAALHDEFVAGEIAVTRAIEIAGKRVKSNWRRQIKSAGLGNRLANTIRAQRYPRAEASINAASLVWSKAPEIIGAHDCGALIRSKEGFWLTIPLPAAGKASRGKRMTPGEWERRNGTRLRFVYRKGRPSMLVADTSRLSKRGIARKKGGRRRKKDGILTGEQTVPIFLMVPQVKLRKRLDLQSAASQIAGMVPSMIVNGWR